MYDETFQTAGRKDWSFVVAGLVSTREATLPFLHRRMPTLLSLAWL